LYACKIKKTANGGWRRPCGEARETFEVIAQRTVKKVAKSMSERQLREFAKTKRKELPKKKRR
jgi:hypothetical protein